MSRRIAALALSAVALLGLTACTGLSPISPTATPSSPVADASSPDAPGDEGQSAAEACALIQDTIDEASAEFEGAAADDPAAVVEAMRSAGQKLTDAATQITNDEVAAVVPPLQEMFTQIGDIMGAIVEGDASKLGELGELGESFQQTSEAFQEVCAA